MVVQGVCVTAWRRTSFQQTVSQQSRSPLPLVPQLPRRRQQARGEWPCCTGVLPVEWGTEVLTGTLQNNRSSELQLLLITLRVWCMYLVLEKSAKEMCYNKNYQEMRLFVLSLFPFSRLFPTCFGPSWAHHQGYFKLLFLCYHLVHAVLCWSPACVSGLVCGGDFRDGPMKARNM